MGLFSSEYKTTVGTTVSRVVQDATIVPSLKTGVIASFFSEDSGQLVENVMESMAAGMGVRAERMYSYAKRSYTYGLPSSKVSTATDGKLVVMGVIKALVDPAITESYYHVGPINNLHVGWVKLLADYGYVSSTNQLATLTAIKGYPVYLKDMVVVIKEATLTERNNGSLDQWGTAAKAGYTPERTITSLTGLIEPTPFTVDPAAAVDDAVLVTYVWKIGDTVYEESMTLPITGYDRVQDYFQVKYVNGLEEGYWLYRLGAGTHLEIDTIFDITPSSAGQFFPFIYFRHGAVSMAADLTAQGYKTSKRMMKNLGINYLDTITAIHENPSIDQVDQALLTFAVPANTTNQMEQRYLFDFFSKMYLAAGGIGVGTGWDVGDVGSGVEGGGDQQRELTSVELLTKKLLGLQTAPRIRIVIEDTRLSTALSCQGIFKKKKVGVAAAIGSYASSFITEQMTYKYTKREIIGYAPGDGPAIYGDVAYTYDAPIDSHIYKHQISANVYEEVQVYDLKMTYYVYGGYSTIGNDLDAILLVPLDHAITDTYSIPDKELLYTRAMHYVFNSHTVTEVAWYQQGWFADLLMIAAIIITVVSLGSDGGLFMQLAAVTAGTITIEAFVMFIAMGILKQMVIAALFTLFVQAVGADFAMLVAIVAAVYGGYKAFEAGSIQGAPWAKELLSLSSNLSSAVNTVMADALNGLKREADQFNLLMKEKSAQLDTANKLLEQRTMLSPVVIFGEKPDDFYNRTVHSGNIGIVGIDSIASYVDIALTLPKLNETIEGNSYG